MRHFIFVENITHLTWFKKRSFCIYKITKQANHNRINVIFSFCHACQSIPDFHRVKIIPFLWLGLVSTYLLEKRGFPTSPFFVSKITIIRDRFEGSLAPWVVVVVVVSIANKKCTFVKIEDCRVKMSCWATVLSWPMVVKRNVLTANGANLVIVMFCAGLVCYYYYMVSFYLFFSPSPHVLCGERDIKNNWK